MPSLDEVMTHFPEQSFLIHIKSNDTNEGKQLAGYLSTLSKDRLESITVYGGDVPISVLKEELPNLRVMSMETIKSCIIPYIAAGWTGFIPNECKDAQLHIPE